MHNNIYMKFINRIEEMRRLDHLAHSKRGGLAVIWGRRRVGKTRLLLEWAAKHEGVYYVADESSPAIQRKYLALALADVLPNFADVEYPDWRSLFSRLAKEAKYHGWHGPFIIDELPYLVASSPELPSILQGFFDREAKAANLIVALSGSSQRMMQGAVLAPSAPLYGRADELFKLQPISIAYMSEALKIKKARDIVEAFTIWGGIPRYWELVSQSEGDLYEKICDLVLDSMSPLQEEPNRLLLEESSSAIVMRPILDAIGLGAHRLSEIAARVEKPATSLSRVMQQLIDLDLIYREVPYGRSASGSKKALYKINDPFVRFWFEIVASKRSLLAHATQSERLRYLKKYLPKLFSITWEELCRAALPSLSQSWGKGCTEAGRYWQGRGHEWDIVALAEEKRELFLGEAKWISKRPTNKWVEREINALRAKGIPPIPRPDHLKVCYLLFVPEKPPNLKLPIDIRLIDAKEVITAMIINR
ncbi:MAG: hypothetical protein KR126chlam2_00068 [Chlamydiae bacterium]|nr:hypothetical protein [Chlamydiota bacterium]